MSQQFRPSLRDRIYWSRVVQGAIDVAIVIVSLVVLLVVEPARLVRRLFAPVDDAVGEPTLYREPGGEVPIAPAQPRAPIAMGRAPAPGYARRALDCYSPAGLRAGLADLWERPSSQLPSLDALRAVAVLLVIASHWYVKDYASAGGPAVSWPSLAENPALALLRLICLVGWTGVDLFFVLSGFLIGGMLWREIGRRGTIDFPRFFWRRAFRIWPLYFATLAYAVGMGVLDATPIRVEWSDWLLVSNYVRGGFSRGWTLSTEEQFYIVIPLLLVALVPLFRDRATRRVRLGGFLAALASLELLVLAVRFVQLSGVVARGIDPSHADFTLVYPFHTHVEGLLAGLCIALLTVVRPEWFDRGTPRLPAWAGAAGLAAGVALFVALRLLDHHLFVFVEYGAFYGGCLWFALADRSWITRRFMAARAWYPLSRLTYGMYLNHWWALPFATAWGVTAMRAASTRPGVVFAGSLAIGIVVSAVLAAITFLLVERPWLAAREVYAARHPERRPMPSRVSLPPGVRPIPGDRIPGRRAVNRR